MNLPNDNSHVIYGVSLLFGAVVLIDAKKTQKKTKQKKNQTFFVLKEGNKPDVRPLTHPLLRGKRELMKEMKPKKSIPKRVSIKASHVDDDVPHNEVSPFFHSPVFHWNIEMNDCEVVNNTRKIFRIIHFQDQCG